MSDINASQHFFELLGGIPMANGLGKLIRFPGMFVVLDKGEPPAGSVGSTVNHFGFRVKSMEDWLPKWQAAGLRIEPIVRPTQVYLLTPDDVRVEILEEPSLSTPIAAHHIHFFTQDIPAMQTWYVKTFGAVPGMRAQFQAADLPGINLSFSPAPATPVPTAGRALDSIGFEVSDLPDFIKKINAAGYKIVRPYAKIQTHQSLWRPSRIPGNVH